MDRKAKEEGYQVTGCVNFPIADDKYEDTHEGGMFVRLVVIDVSLDLSVPTADWMQCYGGYQFHVMDEMLIYDDLWPLGDDYDYVLSVGLVSDSTNYGQKEYKGQTYDDWLTKSFPHYQDDGHSYQYYSRPYLAVLTLGSTNWTGKDKQTWETWHCTFKDLTEEGKMLYQMLQKIYGAKGEIHLQTWVDT